MPTYNDNPITIDLVQGTHAGASILIRSLGISKYSSLLEFVADIENKSVGSFDCKVKYWRPIELGNPFEVESETFSFSISERKTITFEDWIFCGLTTDFFYATIEITSWPGATLSFDINNSYLVRSYDSLMLNLNGNLLRSESAYNSGVLLDIIDGELIRDTDYINVVNEFINRSVGVHLIKDTITGVYPRSFVDGDFRVFNSEGDSMQLVSFDHDDSIALEGITVTFLTGTTEIMCMTNLGYTNLDYDGPDFYDFEITDGNDTEEIQVWVDVEKSADAGAISISDIHTTAVRKYIEGSLIEQKGFELVTRTNAWMNYYKPVDKSIYVEELDFTQNGLVWEATLSYDAIITTKDDCLLTRNSIPIPDDYWDFVDGTTIQLINAEYDSTATYEFEYSLDQYFIYEIDLTDYQSINEMYLLPFIDWFTARNSRVSEVPVTEGVVFDSTGLGYLKYYSNEEISEIVVTKIMSTGEEILPASAIVALSEDTIQLAPYYYDSRAMYIVSYTALMADPHRFCNPTIYWQYQKVDSSWSDFVEWDERTLVPWKYFDSIVRDISKIRVKLLIEDLESLLIFVRGVGLIVLSLREGELI